MSYEVFQQKVNALVKRAGGGLKVRFSHDVNFLLSVYSRKNRKALTVTTANHKALRGYLAEICHRIVTKKQYAVDYKAVKQQ